MLGADSIGEWPVAAPPLAPDPAMPEPAAAEPAAQERAAQEPDPDPWTRPEELPVAPLGELDPQPESEPQPAPEPLVAAQPVPALIPPPVSATQPGASQLSVAVEATSDPDLQPEPEPSLDLELARSAQGVARYSLDPLADPAPRRRFGRGSAPEPDAVEVPARPEGVRALPGRTNRQD
jgi:hypothetical protein